MGRCTRPLSHKTVSEHMIVKEYTFFRVAMNQASTKFSSDFFLFVYWLVPCEGRELWNGHEVTKEAYCDFKKKAYRGAIVSHAKVVSDFVCESVGVYCTIFDGDLQCVTTRLVRLSTSTKFAFFRLIYVCFGIHFSDVLTLLMLLETKKS